LEPKALSPIMLVQIQKNWENQVFGIN